MSHWRGWGLTFTDGMCDDCAVRARAEWRIPTPDSAVMVPRPRRRSLRPDFALTAAVVMLAVTVTFGLIVGPPASGPVTTPDAITVARGADEPGAPNGAPASSASDPSPAAPTPPSAVPPARAPAAGAVARGGSPPSPGSAASLSSGATRRRLARARASGRGGAGRARVVRAAYRPVIVSATLDVLAVEAPAQAPPTEQWWLPRPYSDQDVQAP